MLSFVFKTADEKGVTVRDTVVVDLKADRIVVPGVVGTPVPPTAPASRATATRQPAKKAKKAKTRAKAKSGRK